MLCASAAQKPILFITATLCLYNLTHQKIWIEEIASWIDFVSALLYWRLLKYNRKPLTLLSIPPIITAFSGVLQNALAHWLCVLENKFQPFSSSIKKTKSWLVDGGIHDCPYMTLNAQSVWTLLNISICKAQFFLIGVLWETNKRINISVSYGLNITRHNAII